MRKKIHLVRDTDSFMCGETKGEFSEDPSVANCKACADMVRLDEENDAATGGSAPDPDNNAPDGASTDDVHAEEMTVTSEVPGEAGQPELTEAGQPITVHKTKETKRKMTGLEFSSEYRFKDGGKVTAILDRNGKLSLVEASGLEVWESWRDYVKEKLEEKPATGLEELKLNQIGIALGEWEQVGTAEPAPGEKESVLVKEGESMAKTATAAVKKTAAKKPAPVKKAAAPPRKEGNPKEEKVISSCLCGCGGNTTGKYCPGHDARVHSWAKKIAKGEMKFSEIPAVAQKHLKSQGVVQGAKA